MTTTTDAADAGWRGGSRTLAKGVAVPRGFEIPVPDDRRRSLAIGCLALGMAALLAAGLLSLLLVAGRTPVVQGMLPVADLFHKALVAHVDLSVLVWFLAMAGVMWSLDGSSRWMAMGWTGVALATAGALAILAAPFAERAVPVMSNYIPVLDGPVFLAGLGTFGAGFALIVARSMLTAPRVGVRPDGTGALRFGLDAAAVSGALALVAFVWSWRVLPAGLDGRAFYELLFWGGGHVLQFTYTLTMLVAWLWLCTAIGAPVPLSPRVVLLLFGIGLASAFATPFVYLAYDIGSVQHHRALTWIMRSGGGLAIGPMALAVVVALARSPVPSPAARPLRAALTGSLALFCLGGVVGFLIHGSNVKIPAHYHGCIVGVTLALMGLTYHLLPKLGLGTPAPALAAAQCRVYAVGQAMHVAGLVWSGGYGVQRKLAGAAQVLHTPRESAAMGLMGLGGAIAIAGGFMFLLVVAKAYRGRRAPADGSNDGR